MHFWVAVLIPTRASALVLPYARPVSDEARLGDGDRHYFGVWCDGLVQGKREG